MSLPPNIERTHAGTVCLQVINRSVRRIPVSGSTLRERVSTAVTCVVLSFQGQYFRQLAVLTSAHV